MSWDIRTADNGTFSIVREGPDDITVYSEIAAEAEALDYICGLYQFLHLPAGAPGERAARDGANAPYKIQPRDGKYVVVNNTGAVKATFDDRDKALAYLRALYANVKGAATRAEKVKFSGKAKERVATKASK